MGWDIPPTIFLVLTHTGYTLCPHCKYVKFWINVHIKIKSSGKQVFDPTTNLLCPREESLQFFSKIYLFQTFYSHIYPQTVHFFIMPIQMDIKQKYFNCLLLLKFELILPPKIFRIKRTATFCVFCGLRYSSDNLLSFDTNALYFMRSLYIRTRQIYIKIQRR